MRQLTYLDALNEALREEMERDQSVFLIGEDISVYGGVFGVTKGLLEKFGEMRVRETPISECGIIGAAVGAAMTGLRPVAEIMYMDFITTAMDQVVNQAAKLSFMSGGCVKVPLVVRTQFGSGTREAAQHSQSLEAWFVHTPGLKVVMPSTVYDAKGLLKSAIRDDSPVIFMEHRFLYTAQEEVPGGEWVVPLGEAAVKRKGKDITIVAGSFVLGKALKAAEALAPGIEAEVIDPRTVHPLDAGTIISSVKKTGRLLVVQEACARCSVGAEIVRRVTEEAFDSLDAPPRVLGAMAVPMPYSAPLEDAVLPQVEDIKKAALQML